MARIDSHVHAFPDRLARAVRDRLNGAGLLTGGVLIGDVAALVQANGFDGAWILPYAHRAGVAETVNEWSAVEVAKHPGLVPGATFHPADEHLPKLVERALVDLRLRVVKLHCSVGQFSPADPRLAPLWEMAAARGVPVVIHAGQRSGGDTADDEVDEIIPVLSGHPGLNIVLAHSGLPNTKRTLELMERFPNLHADLTPVWLRPVDVTAADFARFPGRFLFGSDAPNCPTRARELQRAVASLGLPAGHLVSVLGGAAERLTRSTAPA